MRRMAGASQNSLDSRWHMIPFLLEHSEALHSEARLVCPAVDSDPMSTVKTQCKSGFPSFSAFALPHFCLL